MIDERRFVIVRERSGPWWRRYRWAVEDKWPTEPNWRLRKSGFAISLPKAFEQIRSRSLPFDKLERIEGKLVIERTPLENAAPEPTPLPPQLLNDAEAGQ